MSPIRSSHWSQEEHDHTNSTNASLKMPNYNNNKSDTCSVAPTCFRCIDGLTTPRGSFQWDVVQQQMHTLLTNALDQRIWDLHASHERTQWRMAISKKQFRESSVRTFRQRRGHHHKSTTFKCLATVALPLDQVMECYEADNTIAYRDRCGWLYGTHFLDGAVVQVMQHHSHERGSEEEQATNAHPKPSYLGVHWAALKSSSALVKSRHFSFCRSLGYTSCEEGETQPQMGFVVLQSVDWNACANVAKQLGLVRAKLSSVLLCRPTSDKNSTQLVWQGDLDFGGLATSRQALGFVHQLFATAVAQLRHIAELRQLQVTNNLEIEQRHHWVPDSYVKRCYLCHRWFNFWRSRRRCQLCDTIMCGKCEMIRDLDHEVLASDVRTHASVNKSLPPKHHKTMRLCKRCGIQIRRANNQPYARTSSSSSQPRESSDSLTWTLLQGISYSANNNNYIPTSRNADVSVDSIAFTTLNDTALFEEEPTDSTPQDLAVNKRPKSPQASEAAALVRTTNQVVATRCASASVQHAVADEEDEVDVFEIPHAPSQQHCNTSYESHEENMALAMRLWEMNCKAQEALETTKRNSLMMSDTGSAHGSDCSSVNPTWEWRESLDRNIAMQSDLLHAMTKGTSTTGNSSSSSGNNRSNAQSKQCPWRYSIEPTIPRSYYSESYLSPTMTKSLRFEYIG